MIAWLALAMATAAQALPPAPAAQRRAEQPRPDVPIYIRPMPSLGARAQPPDWKPTDPIASDLDFTRLARIEGNGRFLELPQVMFAIVRGPTPHVLWIDTKRYPYHLDFLQTHQLAGPDGDRFNAENYSRADRKFILGSVVRYPRLGRYGVELWEGDIVEPRLLAEMMRALQARFHAPLTFKANSSQQLAAAQSGGMTVIGIDEAYGSHEQLVLNGGRAVGRLVVVEVGREDRLLPGDIALLKTMPIRLPPVAGIVSSSFTTPINHVSLLAKTWRIPNAYRADADHRWQSLAGKQVMLDTTGSEVVLRLATSAEVQAAQRARAKLAVRAPKADRAFTGLPALSDPAARRASRSGAKAANLAMVTTLAGKPGELAFDVPPGFSVPFAYYDHFVAANGIGPAIDALLKDPRRDDPDWRRDALAALRSRFAAGRIPEADFARIAARRQTLLGDKGVFVRSSTNAEDLRGFNGAGLYDTVPNVLGRDPLAAAIKTVWGSLWNERAFAARAAAGIDHRAVRAAVLIQRGIDADSSGVMTTVDPFDERSEERRIFIAAKRGIGIRVVEGRKIAEQLIYRPDLDAVQILSRSQDDIMLRFAPDGGVKEEAAGPERAVLTDDLVRRLGQIGLAIQQSFGNRPQDIEWLVSKGRIMIVQSRDYVKGQ